MDLLSVLSTTMGTDFEQLLSLFMPALLTLCARTNKVVVNRAKGSILTIIQSAQLASVLTYFLQNIKDKSATLKVVIAEGTLACLNSCNPPDFEKEARAAEVESIIRITARDANADVRKLSRKIFESYKILLPSRIPGFITPLSPTTKKYLDIKGPALPTQKSVPNLRAADMNKSSKPEPKPSSSSSFTTLGAKPTHSRTASSSTTISNARSTGPQIGQQQSSTTNTLTRVSRKEPTASRTATVSSTSTSAAPVRHVQPSRVMTDDGSANPRQRTTSTAQRSATTTTSGPSRTLRSQPSIISRSTTAVTTATMGASSGGAQRIQKDPAAAGATSTSNQQRRPQPQGLPSASASASTATATAIGPRRVPMPPPPPAPKKDKNTEGPKRPSSRIGGEKEKEKDAANAFRPSSSTSTRQPRSVIPPAPVKRKPAVPSLSSSVRDKVPAVPTTAGTLGGHARSKSTVVITSTSTATSSAAAAAPKTKAAPAVSTTPGTNIKPLAVAKAKPLWGSRPAPPAKPVSGAPGVAGAAAKGLVRKPSSRVVSGSSSTVTGVKGAAVAKGTSGIAKRPITPAQTALPPSPTLEEEEKYVEKVTDNESDKIMEAEKNKLPEEKESVDEAKSASQRGSPVPFAPPAVPDVQQEQQIIEGNEQVNTAEADAVTRATEVEELEGQDEVISRNTTPTPESSERVATVAVVSFEEAEDGHRAEENDEAEDENDQTSTPLSSSRQPFAPVPIPYDPHTPQQHLLVPSNIDPTLNTKTPISALLSSIERGFQYDYSPITPLSPAANYLPNVTGEGTPYSHATHAPHRRFPMKEGPVQPFNHALHVMGHNGMFEGYGAGTGYNTSLGENKGKMGGAGAGGELGVVPVPVQFGTENMYVPVGLPGLDDGRMAFFELNNTRS
ncbi:hypothetical protein CPB84DRAFT_1791218 [Gymnopilus junonius]|uniref:CLASP N-terminal domain-containing protein n=1 Tax=Gymnopilus junonius TaxID=109634 RepID=A0A9P5NGD0_GYMJU|nr:hypothetical protein CPB84DRAFT_1791218 [Gymnopilus junonius]